ncbi:MAG: hypothetical protein DWQ37_02535 [Planctomycetota bacterium]|nr:MAG: hypothetical protein DWQ37_02535 [Planctomycetota bacterium]
MTRRIARLLMAAALVGLVHGAVVEKAEADAPTSEERTLVRLAQSAIRKAGGLYNAKKYDEAGEAIVEAAGNLAKLPGNPSPELAKWVSPLRQQVDRARKMLADKGVKVPEASTPAEPNRVQSEEDSVLFARDVAPLLVTHCVECHGDRNARSGFSVYTFARLLREGASGPAIEPGEAEASLLVKKLLGTADGDRMPQGADPLPRGEIAKIEAWIAAGAKFGGNASLPLEEVIARAAAESMTHEELAGRRFDQAERTWRLILPDVQPRREESKTVLVVGGVGQEQLAAVARAAEEQAAKLRKLFGVPDEQPLIKGRLTLYVFDKRFEYGEVGVMLERREIPQAWRGHWRYGPLDTYGCVLLDEQGQASAGLVGQLLAGVYASSLGQVPRWFAEGTARAVAERLDPRDERVAGWDDHLREILERVDDPAGFLTASLPPEESDVLAYSFVSKLLMTPSRKYTALVSQLQQGADFDTAFAKIYRGKPQESIDAWLARVGRRR